MSSEAGHSTNYRKWSNGFSRVLRELERELEVEAQASVRAAARSTNELDEFSATFTNLFKKSGSRSHLFYHRQPIDEYTGFIEDRCCACDETVFGDGQFFRRKLYCPGCFLKADIHTCYACHHPIDGRAIFALGRAWHPEHLTCTKCDSILSGGRFYVNSGLLYCRAHFGQQIADICHACREPLFEASIQWANKTYCPDHFRCDLCATSLKAK
ncbi:unnamed protein product [Schistocephalus solidus]|uniref:LIM zinc-binding domain-containing protein n=1 Tax=Schistocephalus solidus TaxID=70667 RepID=A0A183SNT8_SCHSO|nr:unnamed protein product [Schistocephalus solidus]